MNYDVLIIGGGISGACIARELSKTKASICIVEKENDIACGSSKANSGIIHAGYDPIPGTLMAKLNIRGSELYPSLAKKLNFEYKNIGSLVLAFDEKGLSVLNKLLERGTENGVPDLKILYKSELPALEANIGPKVIAALYAPTAGITSPYQATWAFAESAVINGVTFIRNAKVHKITKKQDEENSNKYRFTVEAGGQQINANYIINCAGTAADQISQMAGARNFKIKQRRGEYMLFDNSLNGSVAHVLFQTPTELGKGTLVTPTVDGNILVGPSANDQEGELLDYTGTTALAQNSVYEKGLLSIKELPRNALINSFSGIRAIACNPDNSPIDDFIIEEDSNVGGFINVAGICSPGLSAAPAIAEYVTQILEKAGLDCTKRKDFIEERQGIPNFSLSDLETKEKLIKENHLFGQVICRCETITEAEIVAAIHSPLGAKDTDGVKRRTRAGMGRCQAGFCLPRVAEILSRELKIPMTNVSKNGGSSFLLTSEK
ncbi:MAG: NAD(P)/FAD-dependent oxidoreductase [Treponema sp.]|nr:NAD(P)/FAD-dependent oxidoreductase [Treponema sp.]